MKFNGFEAIEHVTFDSVALVISVVGAFEVQVVDCQEDHIHEELEQEEVLGVLVPLEVDDVLHTLLLEQLDVLAVLHSP